MRYRHEVKHLITLADKLAICHSMDAIAEPDSHVGPDGLYHIRSLYFDNLYNKALYEKKDGLYQRDKYRLRYYEGNTDFILLERKSKTGDLCSKLSCRVTAEEVERILENDIDWMATSGRGLLIELYVKMKTELLRPKVIIDYTRRPYIYGPGNVRVTLDYDIRTGISSLDFLNPDSVTVPAVEGVTILEVKWDEFLPTIIKKAVQLKGVRAGAFSKYEAARLDI